MVNIVKPKAGRGAHRGKEDTSGTTSKPVGRHRFVSDDEPAGAPEVVAALRGRNLSARDQAAITKL